MKKILGCLVVVCVLIGTAACGKNAVSEGEAARFVKEYKAEQYTVEDPANIPTGEEIGEKVKRYLSKEEFERQLANRTFSLTPDMAKKMNRSIKLQSVKLKKEAENEDGTVRYNYTMKLKIYDDETSDIVEKQGQLTLANEDGLKIMRDWEDQITKISDETF
ncbi:hypothetical protein [Bacillus badius]|uniref:Lipoprotein n=1 Tax=Bacillus badius TaxID=1455 RepID=A0ABR5AVQ3_BACBA|nr:hypothetical protein [Bacillus badius]KIL76687.1 hypothetical protein SD78_0789 [Bacillus badius]KIL78805.1 hypothetical protein SD77_4485 [Bacillus badius]KZN98380.1 hypothetical protein A4244_10280 [Bacillus badius]MED0666870.1 hypothetical protein [Bacillus badius]MED4715903.1 hypothetical protein [Bacillus badius]